MFYLVLLREISSYKSFCNVLLFINLSLVKNGETLPDRKIATLDQLPKQVNYSSWTEADLHETFLIVWPNGMNETKSGSGSGSGSG